MAAVPITINGVFCDKYGRTITPCMIVGEATLTGLGVGGGPIVPPDKPGTGDPPGIWGGPIDPYPGHPLPEPPGKPDQPPPIDPNTPPVHWKPVWTPTNGWVVVGIVDPSVDHVVPSS